MGFSKKVLVLKQVTNEFSINSKPISGIARTELENGVFSIHLSLINFAHAASGEFSAFLVDGKRRVLEFKLGKRPSSFSAVIDTPPDLSQGFAVGVCLISSDLPIAALFAREDGFNFSLTDFRKVVADKCLESRKNFKRNDDTPVIKDPEVKPPYPPAPAPDPTVTPPEEFPAPDKDQRYNDEAVATENYFELDQKIDDKLLKIKEKSYDWLRLENELPFNRSKEETPKSKADGCGAENETDANFRKESSKQEFYFNTIRKDLTELLLKYPEEEQLAKTFPDGKFVRVNYSPKKYYVVGLIKENGKEKYVCYGVPAVYSPEPPKELKGFCQFIPLSIFNLTGDGYWMMFQDAASGECIKMK